MYYEHQNRINMFQVIRKEELYEYEDGKPFAFKVVNWKILSLFLALAAMLFVGLIIFWIERYTEPLKTVVILTTRVILSVLYTRYLIQLLNSFITISDVGE